MKLNIFKKCLAVSAVATVVYAAPAMAYPIFSFQEVAGWDSRDFSPSPSATGGNVLVRGVGEIASQSQATGPNPYNEGNNTYSKIEWNLNEWWQMSSLELSNPAAGALSPYNWTTITTLTHNNFDIPHPNNWTNIDVIGRLQIFDAAGGSAKVVDDEGTTTLGFLETPNQTTNGVCPYETHVGGPCDDLFYFTAAALNPLIFNANDGTKWQASFRLGNFVGSYFDGISTVWTAEGTSSHLDVQMRISQIPEPGTLFLAGLGLFGVGFFSRRKSSVA
jgi:hypothetical protein